MGSGLRIKRIVVVIEYVESDSDKDNDTDFELDQEYVESYINKVFFA
jgi:hypothetical protein